jgi:hypothetical protein
VHLSNASEVERLDELLDRFQQQRGTASFKWVSLVSAYKHLQPYSNGGRIFSSLVDLRFNVTALEHELGRIGKSVNEQRQKRSLNPGPLLENEELFLERLALLEANTAYILRYRAILDKIMAVLVLLVAPSEYDSFMGAKSRRRSFVKLAERSGQFPSRLVEHVVETINAFDSKYRTAEAHGTGSARFWTFLDEEDDDAEGPQVDMFWAWNSLHPLLTLLGRVFEPGAEARMSSTEKKPEGSSE